MDREKEMEVSDSLVQCIVQELIAEIDYSYPHKSPKDIERDVDYALVDVGVGDRDLDYERKREFYRRALRKTRKILYNHL